MSAQTDTLDLIFPQLARSITARSGETVYEAARRYGVRIVGACGGRGTCGSCMVRIGANGSREWVRACQTRPGEACVVEVAPRSLAPVVRADVESPEGTVRLALDPAVAAHDITVAEASLIDTASDFDRVQRAIPGRAILSIDAMAARQLPAALRDNAWSVRTVLRGNEAIAFTALATPLLGLAVDLGTTNAAAFLIDLETGVRLASLGVENPQTAWGADLIARINHAARDPDTADDLREAAVTAINALAHDLCHAVGASSSAIADIAICGNTAMQHLLLGLPVRQLGRAPFVAAVRDALDVKARDIGIAAAPGAYVHIAPVIGGFVGGDHVTALLASRNRWQAANVSFVMDIGTNTEISLIHRGAILSASCPSGPALEGGHIASGMRAADGAIERVYAESGRLRTVAIGGKKAIGLCGSGVLDAVAALRRIGVLDDGGRLKAGHPDIGEVDGKRTALLAPDVQFTQSDVRAVQLAKAAIRTGVDMLLREAGLHERDIERFIIAGAFGAYISVPSAVEIGLLPDLPLERFEQIGNAAGAGIRQMLASIDARAEAAALAASCRYVELSSRTDFQESFIENIGFKSRRTAQ